MRLKIAVIFNQPEADRYQAMGENRAELGVLDEVKAVRQSLDEIGYYSLLVPLRPPLEQVPLALKRLNAWNHKAQAPGVAVGAGVWLQTCTQSTRK